MKRFTLIAAMLCALPLVTSAQLVAKKLAERMSQTDASNAVPVEMYAEGKTKTERIEDGTQTVTFRCVIPESAHKIAKAYGQSDYVYNFMIQLTDCPMNPDQVGASIFSEQGNTDDWASINDGKGYLEFEVEKRHFVEFFGDESGALTAGDLQVEVTLTTQGMKGITVINKSTATIHCDGADGAWAKAETADLLASYKSGERAESRTTSEDFKRMLQYSRDHFSNADIVHLKVVSSDITDDNRLATEIWVTMSDDEGCSFLSVVVWEDRYSHELHNYVPQTVDPIACSLMSQIRNVK